MDSCFHRNDTEKTRRRFANRHYGNVLVDRSSPVPTADRMDYQSGRKDIRKYWIPYQVRDDREKNNNKMDSCFHKNDTEKTRGHGTQHIPRINDMLFVIHSSNYSECTSDYSEYAPYGR